MTTLQRVRAARAAPEVNRRLLIVDDNPAIHEDFRKILAPVQAAPSDLDALLGDVFGTFAPAPIDRFELDFASQGQDALEAVRASLRCGRPYALVFMDVRMPPGWDGIKTTSHILSEDPDVAVVICSAYSDHSWEDLARALGGSDRVLILKKPFDTMEVRQLAHALHRRWELGKQAALKLDDLERLVRARTEDLAATNDKLRAEAEAHERLDAELRLAQKLEAVGRLAAGVAHEINTPVQFVSDSINFVKDAMSDLFDVLQRYESLGAAVARGDPADAEAREVLDHARDADLPYLIDNIPLALARATDGLRRVATIVRSMKAFSHPDQAQMAFADLNEAIQGALTLAAGEYKYTADVTTELGLLPPVMCHLGELNQVILNVVVNAAHAIGDAVGGSNARGLIAVRSWAEGDRVVIAISDSGTGIPAAVRERIFDPFFTTKALGKGTGQGLALAHSVVHERHGGTLTFDTEPGRGTTFFIRLPVAGMPSAPDANAPRSLAARA